MTPLQNNANAAKKGSRRDFVPQVWPGTATLARRDLAVASVFALGGSNLLQRTAAHAEAADESAIGQAVEALREAVLDKDKTRVEELTAAAELRPFRRQSADEGGVYRRRHDPQSSRQIADLPRPQREACRQRRGRPPHLRRRIRDRGQTQQHHDRRPRGLAEAGQQLEAAGPPGLQAGLRPRLYRITLAPLAGERVRLRGFSRSRRV